ncbi:MAG: hypothetical protein AB1726_06430 [Planctomycetota bacterium]
MSKHVTVASILGALGLSIVLAAAGTGQTAAPPAARIGTFDSRAVALAYWRSAEGMARLEELHADLEKARAAKDEKRIRELEIEGPGRQVRMHQQVFSTGTVTDILARIQTSIPAIAKEAGVPLVVSKWEVAYRDPSVECVDVTPQLVALFHPDEGVRKMLEGLAGQEPVPIDQLSKDPNH